MKKVFLLLSLIGILLFSTCPGFSQNDVQELKSPLLEKLQKAEKQLPQQKVYLHTDKDQYLAGEKIWFKAYVVSASGNTPHSFQTNLNVDLINENGKFIDFSILDLKNGLTNGSFHLPDSLHEGGYYLRAYTDCMKNFDQEFYFLNPVHVVNPIEENFIRRSERRRSQRFNRKLENQIEQRQFAFFPESGQMLKGVENRIAFKAADGLGEGVEASGQVYDDQGSKLLSFETFHEGMGRFELTPESGRSYKAKVKFDNGRTEEFALPKAVTEGYSLRIDPVMDGIEIMVKTNFPNPSELSILAHAHSTPAFYKPVTFRDGVFKTIVPFENLPDGITNLTLFKNHEIPVAERLAFVLQEEIREVEMADIQTISADEGNKTMKVDLLFEADPGIPGSYSVAAVGSLGQKTGKAPHLNMAAYLMLSSEIKGQVKDPGFYLQKNEQNQKAADLLMMTHGWRRFDWTALLDGEVSDINDDPEEGIEISGKLKSTSRSHSAEGVSLKLTTKPWGNNYYTETGKNGEFAFSGLDYQGSVKTGLVIETDAPGRVYEIGIDDRQFEKIDLPVGFHTPKKRVLNRGEEWSRTSRPDYSVKSTISPPARASGGYYGDPDQVVYMDDIPPQSNMQHFLRTRIRGLTYTTDGTFVLRGVSSVRGSNEPLYIVDDNVIDRNAFLNLRPDELDRVEVLSGSSASILGMRGGNGALVAYSRRSERGTPAFELEFKGYSVSEDFYDSKIKTSHYQNEAVNKTLFWKPSAIPGQDGALTLEFPQPKGFEEIFLLVEGIDQNGQITFGFIEL